MAPLKLAVLGAALWCAGGMALLLAKARSFGPRHRFAPPAGDAAAGIRYAFTGALSPRAKESAREHPLAWGLGVLTHLGVFAAFGQLAAVVAGVGSLRLLAGVALAGFLGALALLGKRLVSEELRGLSVPDDVLASLLVAGFALLAGISGFRPTLQPAFLGWAIALMLYAPLGKLRHMAFFFPARAALGAFLGRRGSFPPQHGGAHGR